MSPLLASTRPRVLTTVLASLAAATMCATPAHALSVNEAAAKSAFFPVPTWSLTNKEEGRVDAFARSGDTVFIGGNFTKSQNQGGTIVTRTYLAAMSVSTGKLTSFAPTINGRVDALELSADGSLLFVGGQFSKVNGVSRRNLATINTATGSVTNHLGDIGIGGRVRSVVVNGSSVFVAGDFTSTTAVPRTRLLRLARSSAGTYSLASDWKPTANDSVRDLLMDGNGNVIAAGWFTSINGKSGEARISRINGSTGAPMAWANHPTSEILQIAKNGGSLYAAMGGPGGTALAYDLATGTQKWYYKTDGNVQGVGVVNGLPVYGMHGDYVATQRNAAVGTSKVARKKIFLLSTDGVLQSWAPSLSSNDGVLGVWEIEGTSDGTLFVGGDFTNVNSTLQSRFAMFRSS